MEDKTETQKNVLENSFVDKVDIKIDESKLNSLSSSIQRVVDTQNNLSSAISESMKPLIRASKKIGSLVVRLNEPLIDAPYIQKLRELQENYSNLVSKIRSPLLQLFESIDINQLRETLKKLADFSVDIKRIKDIYLSQLCEAHWFPHVDLYAEFTLFNQITDAIHHSKSSKSRTKKIDRLVFEHYTNKRIDLIKKSWRKLGLPEYIMRMLHQSVQAYKRREYAITVAMLATLWEGFIYNKFDNKNEIKRRRPKDNFVKLARFNNQSDQIVDYFENFIMYDCRSSEEIIEDVPGRNSAAHSYYKQYPTRKAALNAIMFTDYLLNLDKYEEEKSYGKNENGIA